jgi:hypothetical protein
MMAPATLVRATGTLTLLNIIPTDVFVIGAITYVDDATPNAAYDFDDGADDTATAADAVLCILRSGTPGAGTYYDTGTIANPSATATSALTVITAVARVPGTVGNGVSFSSVDTTITASPDGNLGSGTGVLETGLQSLLDEVQLNSEAISMIAHLTSRSSD